MFSTNRDWTLYVKDIYKECLNIEKFILNVTYEEFTNNLEKVYAVAKAFENIGEAVKQIPKDVTSKYPDIPWSEIAKMRDILTHHYFGVDDKILWDTLDEDFNVFKNTIFEILTQINNK
ncbi:HepT-like ribonuclease domain-containing protein [Aliarcobacter vitoriensis]|uniref:DUF86 domain-containing protein n=1 Tax=Aliarcobacter vitoriensis TaxID=2011099 RepID=A0A366MUD5_9BACT|nr:DUF86 domain-containing protein [Aliarcobacter vitoriensis]RBQ29194.1 DUF86 domain-containing protein [Aliarcobacter vitoriensis]